MILLDKLSFPSRLIVLQAPRRQTAGWPGDWTFCLFGSRLSGRDAAASRSFPIATSCSSFALKRMADCYTIGPDRPLPLPTQKDPLRLGVWIRAVSPCSLFRSGMIASVQVASTDDCRAIHHVLVENCHSSSLRRGYRVLDDHVAVQFPQHLRSGADATEQGAALRRPAAHGDLRLLRFVGTELGRTDNRHYR
jgi:hypothetical protein